MKRQNLKNGVYLLPSLCSTASLFCSFYAIGKTLEGSFEIAAWALFLSGIFDFLDGRIARMTHSATAFGVQYDSLVDLVSFGVAPGIYIYLACLKDFGRVGWFATFLFVACGALRLARYNIKVDTGDKRDFEGLPIPVAGLFLVGLVVLFMELFGPEARPHFSALALTIIMALLMVSNIRFRGLRWINLKNRHPYRTLAAVAGLLFLVSIRPIVVLYAMGCLYVALSLAEYFLLQPRAVEAMMSKIPRLRTRPGRLALLKRDDHDGHTENL